MNVKKADHGENAVLSSCEKPKSNTYLKTMSNELTFYVVSSVVEGEQWEEQDGR